MKCEETLDLIDAYMDDELSKKEHHLLKGHIESCAECNAELEAIQDLKKKMKALPYHSVPSKLQERVSRELAMEEARSPQGKFWGGRVASHAAVFVFGVLGTFLFSQMNQQKSALTSQIFESHLHFTMSHQFGMISSSQSHTVKPWFAGKIDYAPPVIDLTQSGFPLLSGRISYLNGKAVATLSYGRRKHRISVFVVPVNTHSKIVEAPVSKRGYHILGWEHNQFGYQAVSDIHPAELRKFAEVFKENLP